MCDRYAAPVPPKKAKRTTPRLGRPPASDSGVTRERIVDIAIEAYAEFGYEVTTNSDIASNAGITTGALYHYFDSKINIYDAAFVEVQRRIYDRFSVSLIGVKGFVARFETVLETAHVLNREAPSLATFIGAARVDMARNPDLHLALGKPADQSSEFFADLVDEGIASGELRAEDRELVLAFIRTVVVGLTDGVSNDPDRHRVAVDAVRAVVEGRLFRAASK
jgi:AcrR family transcriptional regulator